MIDLIYGAVLGLLMGIASQRIAVAQIEKRTDDTAKVEAINNTAAAVLWAIFSAILFAILFYKEKDTLTRLTYVIYMSIAINIAVVDIDIRRIPNELVLGLLLMKLINIISELIRETPLKETLIPAVLGLVIGFVLYLVPSLFNIPIGAGDIKYCGAIGFCLGLTGFLQTAIIMAAALLVYLGYLQITKRGSAKTVTMMGPYLSLGVIVTLLYPVDLLAGVADFIAL